MRIIHNPTGELKEEDTRTYINSHNNEIREVYKCKYKRNGLGSAVLCDKNQHGCTEIRGLASISCNRKSLQWTKKI